MKVFSALINLALASCAIAVAVDSRVTLPGFEERACGTTGGTFKTAHLHEQRALLSSDIMSNPG